MNKVKLNKDVYLGDNIGLNVIDPKDSLTKKEIEKYSRNYDEEVELMDERTKTVIIMKGKPRFFKVWTENNEFPFHLSFKKIERNDFYRYAIVRFQME